MIKENLNLVGTLSVVLRDSNGNLKDERKVYNIVVNTGLAFIASRMKDATATAMSHMAVGSVNTAAAATAATAAVIRLCSFYGIVVRRAWR